jgi:hypothetical protein
MFPANPSLDPNSDIRLTTEEGNLSNVTVSGNWLLGGGFTVETGNGANLTYAFSNISVKNNYIGFYWYGAYWNGNSTIPSNADISVTGNPIVGYSNPIASTQALAAYKSLISATNVIAATTAGQTLTSVSSAPTTLLGNDLATTFIGSTNETSFVSGYGGHHLAAGSGANIFTYLSISDSTPGSTDIIYGFDPAKDVIDLSRIDANITTPGIQHFTFIGSAPFGVGGAQVRYQLNPTGDVTYVEADLASDSATDFEIVLMGLVPLTASNFAFTAAQSVADSANGAALTNAKVQTPAGGPTEYAYTNVKGPSYSSYESFDGALNGFVGVAAQVLNFSSTSDELRLYDPSITVTRGGGAETVHVGNGADPFSYHPVETIDATTSGSETLVFGTNFGNETIQGFAASGTAPDTIQLTTSSFSYLTAGMTQAQDLAAVLANASSGSSGLTIADSHGDSLTLAGLSAATIVANPTVIKFA